MSGVFGRETDETKYAVVKNGVEENIEVERGEKFTYLDVKGKDMKKIKKIEKINKKILDAGSKKEDVVGSIVYTLDGNENRAQRYHSKKEVYKKQDFRII